MSREAGLPLSAESIRARARNAGLKPERAMREIAINQLHHRLASGSVDWIVKGGEALVARRVSTRATRDLDVRVSGHDLDAAVDALRQAAERDAGDGLIYQVSPPRRDLADLNTGGYDGCTVTVTVVLGVQHFDQFGVDLVVGRELTGSPTCATSPLSLELPELEQASVLLYPSVDHIADKICATHARYGRQQVASSRVKDLYDLCALRGTDDVLAAQLYEAIAAESLARGLPIPTRSEVPTSMRARFEDLSRKEPHPLVPAAFAEAVAVVAAFLDPVLSGQVLDGHWDGDALRWTPFDATVVPSQTEA